MSLKQALLNEFNNHQFQHNESIEFDIPRYNHGDYSLNIAFKLAKTMKKPPQIISEDICNSINTNHKNLIATPLSGFINIKIDNNFLYDYFIHFLNKPPKISHPKNICLEYVSANPTGPLHIGHGRWAVIGDCLSRLLTKVGHNVHKEFYINDAGNQIKLFNDSISAKKNKSEIPENGYEGTFIDYIASKNPNNNIDFTLDIINRVIWCLFFC